MDTPGRPPRRPGPGPERLRRAIRLPGVDPPDSAGRDKPPCCDESTDLPPVLGAAVAELVERAQKYAGQGASQHSDGNAAPVSPARRCTPSRRPERQDLPALPRSLPALPSCTSTRHRIRASEISRSVTSPREPDTLYPPIWRWSMTGQQGGGGVPERAFCVPNDHTAEARWDPAGAQCPRRWPGLLSALSGPRSVSEKRQVLRTRRSAGPDEATCRGGRCGQATLARPARCLSTG